MSSRSPQSTANGENGVLSLFNTGLTTPQNDGFAFGAGTSEAAALVSGVVGLMLSANLNLSADGVRSVLQRTARAFPNGTCTTATCGAGVVDAFAAVSAATAPPPAIPAPPAAAAAPVAAAAAPSSGGGGGGGGGGCAVALGIAAPELGLPLAAARALCMILLRGTRRHSARPTSRA